MRWTQIHLLNNIKEGTGKGESAAPFDFVYVQEIASPLQLAWCSESLFMCTQTDKRKWCEIREKAV